MQTEQLITQSNSESMKGFFLKDKNNGRFFSNDAIAYSEKEKAEKMLENFSNGQIATRRSIQRMRFRLIQNVIRTKLLSQLKRALDLFVAFVAFPGVLFVMIPIALIIKLDSPGPVLFRQKRIGKWGKPFECYKFRSMYIDAEERKKALMTQNESDEIVFKMKNDPRVTRIGRIIRKLSLDEIPQIFNVIKGDMSLVGPRPPVPNEVAQYPFDYLRRLDVIPGITGLQQISGRSDLEFKKWIELDLQYIEEQSLLKDIEILIKTIPAVISGRGAY